MLVASCFVASCFVASCFVASCFVASCFVARQAGHRREPARREHGACRHRRGARGARWPHLDDILAKLNDALNQTVADKGAKERLAAAGIELTGGTPQAFQDFITGQHAYWGETLRA